MKIMFNDYLFCESCLLDFFVGYFFNLFIDYTFQMYGRLMKDFGINFYFFWLEYQEI